MMSAEDRPSLLTENDCTHKHSLSCQPYPSVVVHHSYQSVVAEQRSRSRSSNTVDISVGWAVPAARYSGFAITVMARDELKAARQLIDWYEQLLCRFGPNPPEELLTLLDPKRVKP